MKLACTINGQPAEIEIPDCALTRGSLGKTEAAVFLSVCERTVDTLAAEGRIDKTNYGTFPVAGLQAHLAAETKKVKR